MQRYLQPQNTKKHRGNLSVAMHTIDREWLSSAKVFKLDFSEQERAAFVALRDAVSQKTVQLSRIAPYTHQYQPSDDVDAFLPHLPPLLETQGPALAQQQPPPPPAQAQTQAEPITVYDNQDVDDPYAEPISDEDDEVDFDELDRALSVTDADADAAAVDDPSGDSHDDAMQVNT